MNLRTTIGKNYTYSILVFIIFIYLLQLLTLTFYSEEMFEYIFVLSTENPNHIWTWFTSMFSHGNIAHLLVNVITMFFFAPIVESILGKKRFLILFILSGVLAGLSQIVFFIILGIDGGLVGVSGAVAMCFGVVSVYLPDLKVWVFFVIPIKIWLAASIFIGVSIVGMFTTMFGQNIAHFAHLIGILIGITYSFLLPQEKIVNSEMYDLELF